jgi:hypothetical protein
MNYLEYFNVKLIQKTITIIKIPTIIINFGIKLKIFVLTVMTPFLFI